MIELDRHIEILLLGNDCVIVPDLGGFMTHHVEARYDESDQCFLPPLRTLGFNPQLKMNDSLLAQSYVEAYDLSYPEALRRIEDEVAELKQHLESEGRYELNGIGTLTINDDGRQVFTPCEAGLLTPELYGLSSVEMKRLAASQEQPAAQPVAAAQVKVETREQTATPVQTPAQAQDAADIADEEEETAREVHFPGIADEEEDGEQAIMIKMSWVRNAASIAAIVIACLLMTTPLNNGDSNLSVSNLNNPMLMGMMPKDSNMERIDMSKPAVEQDAPDAADTLAALADTLAATSPEAGQQAAVETETAQEPEAETNMAQEPMTGSKAEAAPTPTSGYCLVLASYVAKKNAEALVERLNKKGLEGAEVYVRNNVTRVIFGHFQTQSEAYNRLNALHSDKDFEEAWVMKK